MAEPGVRRWLMPERYEYVGGPHDGEICGEDEVDWDVFDGDPASPTQVGRYNVTGEVIEGRAVLRWESFGPGFAAP